LLHLKANTLCTSLIAFSFENNFHGTESVVLICDFLKCCIFRSVTVAHIYPGNERRMTKFPYYTNVDFA
jgi:hypothetical protein